MSAPALASVAPVLCTSVSRSHVGRVRAINEDRVFDDAEAGVWAVADGMGGHSGGDLAAQQVVTCLREAACSGEATADALSRAHDAIGERNRRLRLDAGTTVVTATLVDEMLEIAWAGDSRAYRLRNGRAEQLTHDHSLVQQLIDGGLLTPALAENHPHANIVTRALGVTGELALQTVRVAAGGDRFLLCSDGLSRSLRADEVPSDLSLDALADHLLADAIARDGSDNVSLVLIDVVRG